MKTKRLLSLSLSAVALAMSLALGACGTFNGLGDDSMAMLIIYRTDHKPLTREQYDAVKDVAVEMHITITKQLSSPFEAGAVGGVAYGIAGAAGGATQGLFYPGAMTAAAAGYTGAVYGLGGVVNGLTTASYAEVYAVGASTEQTMRDREKYDHATVFERIHVVAAFVRSENSESAPASGLVNDLHGDPVGSPAH